MSMKPKTRIWRVEIGENWSKIDIAASTFDQALAIAKKDLKAYPPPRESDWIRSLTLIAEATR